MSKSKNVTWQKSTVLCALFLLWMPLTVLAHPGIGIVMDSKGNVFYTDLVHVWKITPDGNHSIAVKDVHTHQLYLDTDDNLYGEHVWYEGEATDEWGHYIWCLSSNGKYQQATPNLKGFPVNNTLVRDSSGATYFAEKSKEFERLKRQPLNGTPRIYSNHRFRDIRWMHVPLQKDELYLIDHLSLKKVDKLGKVTLITDQLREKGRAHSSVNDRHYLMGIWLDAVDNIYVAVYGAAKIKRIDSQGNITTIYESSGKWSPCGGLVDPDGNLWVMEFSSRNKIRIKKILNSDLEKIFQN